MLNKKSLLEASLLLGLSLNDIEDLDVEHANEVKLETKEGHILLAPINVIKKDLVELLSLLGIEEGDINLRINECVSETDGIYSSVRVKVKTPPEVNTLKERIASKTYEYYLKLFTKETVH
jgi:homoserine kinase